MPVFFILVITIVILIRYETSKSSKAESQARRDFWQREREASFTRNQDISGLDYIKIPSDLLSSLPELPDETYIAARQKIEALSETQILNLTGLSNTDLKATYGTGNFMFLSECDERFNDLYVALKTIIKALEKNGNEEDAKRISDYLESL